jgi:hypothetical protein
MSQQPISIEALEFMRQAGSGAGLRFGQFLHAVIREKLAETTPHFASDAIVGDVLFHIENRELEIWAAEWAARQSVKRYPASRNAEPRTS